MAQVEHASAGGDCGPDRVDHLFLTGDRQTDGRSHVRRSELGADVLLRQVERAVFEIGGQDLVADRQAERPRGDVHACRRVRDGDEVVRIGADVRTEGRARLREQLAEPSREEEDRLSLELELPSW
jgi:hypothetical protein